MQRRATQLVALPSHLQGAVGLGEGGAGHYGSRSCGHRLHRARQGRQHGQQRNSLVQKDENKRRKGGLCAPARLRIRSQAHVHREAV